MARRTILLILVAALGACRPSSSGGSAQHDLPPRPSPPRYLKGQLHCHSSLSADSATPPEEVVRWYAERGYDFIVLTDHNQIAPPPSHPRLLVFPGVELTQNPERCDPPPEPGLSCILHLNALFVARDAALDERSLPAARLGRPSPRRLDFYLRALEASRQMGGIAQLNHPNFHFAADASIIVELARRGVRLLEVANESSDSANAGDARHPSTEAIWDAALTADVGPVYAVASDDAHHYHDAAAARARGEPVYIGDRGFVMVRARPDRRSIRDAIASGRFYASTGVLLRRAEAEGGSLVVEVETPGSHRFRFVGPGGRVVHRALGRSARFPLPTRAGQYLRAVVEDQRGRSAWVQPVRAR